MSAIKDFGAVLSCGLGPILAAAVVVATGPGWVPVAGILMSYSAIGWAAAFFAPDFISEDEAFCTGLPVRSPDCSARSVPRLHGVMIPARLPKRYWLAR
ncbi:hypothetical protein [Arthrobacter sp. ok909]|uniref:hypothetical protein n=1 Tax=Arthrobacter sp. ok909 TaxID=1761746 RepID=UPI00158707E1|nr:hypothetical protein [Arthrobacter sp. ok909]